MKCTHCGTENQSGFKFCVKCGTNLAKPEELNMEQVGMSGYYSEGEAASDSFTMSSSTFTVSERPPVRNAPTGLFTADELNASESDFDSRDFDEPFIPKLNADRVSLPEQARHPSPPQQPMHNGTANMYEPPFQQNMQGQMPPPYPQQAVQPLNGMPQMNGMPNQQMHPQPQIIGCDPNGMPIYGQPVMYQQPQFLGYDQNGMPVYGQPVMYQQPQIIGYDQNGMPVYGQPVMYQPPVMGAEQNGMPMAYQQNMPAMQNIPTAPQNSYMQSMPMPLTPEPPPQPEPEPQEEKRVDVPDDFWEFFDGGKATKHKETKEDDFFGKHSGDMDDVHGGAGNTMDRLKRFEKKRNDYMGDLPVADASQLRRNDSDKFNRMYMRGTDMADASRLEFNQHKKTQDRMRVTGEVSADSLVKKQDSPKWNIMGQAGEANADQLESYVPQHKQAIMAQASQAVEALPSKKKTYNDLIDEIELPEDMKAKKTVRTETVEIPALPELQDLYSQG
ncbi:MAG: zinc-ribbon domain-containing protein [Ruminococcus sp.]|nr:zinc-ribbon domain-containing protein [Ruminococcus sp.]